MLPTLIPSPHRLQSLAGSVDLRSGTIVSSSWGEVELRQARARLQEAGIALNDGGNARIVLERLEDESLPQRYSLQMDGDEVRIQASGADGLFFGVQTLAQLVQPSAGAAVPRVAIDDEPSIAHRAVHLDLRSNCLMPTFAYLLDLIRTLAHYKYNAVVLEWEDKFPYRRHPEVASSACLSDEQVDQLLSEAKQNHIEVIPLLQCLGHVEYILKQPQHARLRESATDISQFCPTEPGSLQFVVELIDNLLERHPDTRYIHLGGDETWLLGTCPRCAAKAQEQGLLAVYTDYVGAVCQAVLDRGRLPLIWGDIVIGRHLTLLPGEAWSPALLHALEAIPRDTRMVYWDYHGLRPEDFTHFEDYERLGFPVWVAPTTRSGDILPDYATHLPNISSLLEAGIAHHVEGALITSWVWKNMPFDLTWQGLLTGAERAWSGGTVDQTELDRRIARSFFGMDLPELVEAISLLSYDFWAEPYRDNYGQAIRASYLSRNPGHEFRIPDAELMRERALRARPLLAEVRQKAPEHAVVIREWEVAAWLLAHVAEKQMLFDRLEMLPESPAVLLDGEEIARLSERLDALAQEREKLEQVWRQALLRTNIPEAVELDNALRFGGERAQTCLHQEQLRVFSLAEGRRAWR